MRERISSLGRKVGEKEREGNGLKIRMRERRHKQSADKRIFQENRNVP